MTDMITDYVGFKRVTPAAAAPDRPTRPIAQDKQQRFEKYQRFDVESIMSHLPRYSAFATRAMEWD